MFPSLVTIIAFGGIFATQVHSQTNIDRKNTASSILASGVAAAACKDYKRLCLGRNIQLSAPIQPTNPGPNQNTCQALRKRCQSLTIARPTEVPTNSSKGAFAAPVSHNAALVTIFHDDNFKGSSASYRVNWNQCVNFNGADNDRLSSVNTHNNCVVLWEHGDCNGKGLRVAPGTEGHSWVGDEFNDITSSISRC